VGFEGGQMPLQRRLPKVGFTSRKKKYSAELRLSELALVEAVEITLDVLKAGKLIPALAKKVKVIDSGVIEKAITIRGLQVTRGARVAIEAQGGKIEA
jgi:large subunit ribosomal protein L15